MTKRALGGFFGIIAGAVLAAATPVLAAPFAYVTSSFTNDVSVIDAATNTLVTTVPVGSSPFGVAAHPAGSHVYVANFGSNTVSVISTTTHSVAATIPVQDGPFGVAVHPSGARAYVANQFSNTVSVIDTAVNAVVGTIDVGSRPLGVVVNSTGTRLYVANQGSNNVSVVDTATGTIVSTVGVGSMPFGIAVAPDGSRVYVVNSGSRSVSVIDAATNAVTPVTVGLFPVGVAVHPSGSHVYVANNGSGTISVIAAATNDVVASPVAGLGLFGIGVAPSGSHVYVASEDLNRVYVMDTTTNSVTGSVAVPGGPAAFGPFFAAPATCDTPELDLVHALVRALFGDRPNAEVAAAVHDVTRATLEAARAAAPPDPRLLQAQRAFDAGVASMNRGEWTRAVHGFHEAYTLAVTSNVVVPGGEAAFGLPLAAPSSCDPAELDLIHALVRALFGDRPDAEVAAVVREVTQAELEAARAAAPYDPRLRQAQRAFDAGVAAMGRGDWTRAVHEFREAYALAALIQGEASARAGRRR